MNNSWETSLLRLTTPTPSGLIDGWLNGGQVLSPAPHNPSSPGSLAAPLSLFKPPHLVATKENQVCTEREVALQESQHGPYLESAHHVLAISLCPATEMSTSCTLPPARKFGPNTGQATVQSL